MEASRTKVSRRKLRLILITVVIAAILAALILVPRYWTRDLHEAIQRGSILNTLWIMRTQPNSLRVTERRFLPPGQLTPFEHAIACNENVIADMVEQYGRKEDRCSLRGRDLLRFSVARDNACFTRRLIDELGGVDNCDEHGNSLLHLAARHNAARAAETLIRIGAEVNLRNDDGATPLHKAVPVSGKGVGGTFGGIEVMTVLISHGADVNARDRDGRTPLHYANGGWKGNDAVKLLVSNGADVRARDNNDRLAEQCAGPVEAGRGP